MDDICSATKTFPQHLDALDHVFASVGRSGLRLSMKKCEFGVAEIKFLGWTVSKHGIGTQKEKIDAQLAIIKMPRNVKATQRMIGFMQYYRQYIPYLSQKLLPFYKLTKPGNPFKVEQEHKDALEQLKTDLTKCHTENIAPTSRGKAVCANDRRERMGSRVRADDRRLYQRPRRQGDKDVRTSSVWVTQIHPGTIQPDDAREGVPGGLPGVRLIRTHPVGYC